MKLWFASVRFCNWIITTNKIESFEIEYGWVLKWHISPKHFRFKVKIMILRIVLSLSKTRASKHEEDILNVHFHESVRNG